MDGHVTNPTLVPSLMAGSQAASPPEKRPTKRVVLLRHEARDAETDCVFFVGMDGWIGNSTQPCIQKKK